MLKHIAEAKIPEHIFQQFFALAQKGAVEIMVFEGPKELIHGGKG
jgi:hypothetical protein